MSVKARIALLKAAMPGYISALFSGYLLTGSNLLVQFALTPLYLEYLGKRQFGVLMLLLNTLNFAGLGITWMSGGIVRIYGETWAKNDLAGFRNAFLVGKYVFTLYALVVSSVSFFVLWYLNKIGTDEDIVFAGFLAAIYFVGNYESAPERTAFVGTNRQAIGNYIEFIRLLVFAVLTYILLPFFKSLSAVLVPLLIGVVVQRLISGVYWKREAGETGWGFFKASLKPLLKKLAGRRGVGYISFGVMLLVLQADTLLMGMLGGPEAAAQFVLLWKIPEALGLLIWKIPSALEPRIIELDARGEKDAVKSLFVIGRRWYVVLVFLASITYIILGKTLVEIWVGEHAPQAQWMYTLAGVAMFFSAIARWPVSFAYALVRLKPLLGVATSEVVGKLLVSIWLFPYLNIASPVAATIIIHVLYAAIAYQKIALSERKRS